MDRAPRQQLAEVAPEAVQLHQLARLEPRLAREEPLVVAELVVVDLIEEDQRRAAERLAGCCGAARTAFAPGTVFRPIRSREVSSSADQRAVARKTLGSRSQSDPARLST